MRFIPRSARSRISGGCATPPRRTGWNWRSISPSSARPTIPGSASTRTGSPGGRTARSNTRRTRRRNTRTSSTSTSMRRARCRDLWVALCDVVLHWAGEGVRLFRVDNPHTKPLPFWEWMIAEVRAPLSRRDIPGRGVYPAEGDVPSGQGRLLAILHLLHVAKHQEGAAGLSDRAVHDRAARLLPPALLRQHARHQPGISSKRRAVPAS